MKFKYGDKVKVINGFFKGRTGNIESHLRFGIIFMYSEYIVLLDRTTNYRVECIKETDLEKLEE